MITLDTIMDLPNGAHFYKCDLHTHTPKDQSFHTGGHNVQTEEGKKAFARELVRYVREKHNIDVLGVTEHNDVSWLPYIQEAAAEASLIVFPGIELGADGGRKSIHLLALFNPGTSYDNINHWLSSLGLTPDQRFNDQGQPKLTPLQTRALAEKICKSSLEGIAIAAHVTRNNGLLNNSTIQGESRVIAYTSRYINAVEIPEGRNALSEWLRNAVDGNLADFNNKRVACLNHSDGRCLSDGGERPAIGSKATYIKMSTPSIEALRQAFLDFESRIRLESERYGNRYPRIIGVSIEGGFLTAREKNEQPAPLLLHFNPNLNCVIGGRGTGKSALIEALRYAFDIEPKTTTNKKQREDLLARTLPPGTKITVFYETDDHTQYRIERTWNQAPRVFNAKTGEEKTGLHPSHLGEDSSEPVEIYGQKEIYEISKDPEYQLRLLDTYITEDLSSVFEQQTELRRSLENNAQAILSVEKDIVDAQDKVNELPGIRERLNRMEQQEMAARLQRKKDMDTENALLTRATEAIEAVAMALEEVSKAQENTISSELIDESTYSNLPHAEMLGTQRDLLDRIKQTFQDGIQGLIAQLRHIWKEGAVKRSMWQQDYEQEEAVYQQFLRDHPDASADTYISLQKQYQDLESLEKRIKPLEREVADLKQERQKMLEELRILYRKEFNIRHTKTQELNELLGGTVTISVVREGNRKLYRESLKNSFTGTRMSSDNIDHIVSCQDADGYYYDTIALVDAIRNEQKSNNDFSVLESTYGLTEAKRIALTKLAESVLYDLEIFRVPDLPIIKLCVNGQEKSLDELSVGQKCTAILSLILVERNSPLVIDQPEDDLDNRFIFEEIVKTLRHEKERRQFVVATHNANIPVSGDAELIIVLEANESHGWIQCSGSIDDPEIREPVENILEGGREAFRIRQAKYGVE